MTPVPARMPVFLAAIDGDMTNWQPLRSTAATLQDYAKRVVTPEDAPDRARFGYQLELMVHPPEQLLENDNWNRVVGAIIDLESRPGKIPAEEVHAHVCTRLARSNEERPILAKRVGYHLRFLLSTPMTAKQERFIEAIVDEASRLLKSTGADIEMTTEIPTTDMFWRSLRYLEWRMRQNAR